MARFAAALRAWNGPDFASALKSDIRSLASGVLPLHAAVTRGGYVDDGNLEVTVLGSDDHGSAIEARVGVFFTEIVINCGCGDDPMEENAYCEMRIRIDKATAAAAFTVLGD